MIYYIQPVAHILTFTIYWQWLAMTNIVDEQRNQLQAAGSGPQGRDDDKDDNDQLQLVPHFVRNEPKLDVAYKGYTFTPEDKKNLLQNGNLGKVVDFPDKNTGGAT